MNKPKYKENDKVYHKAKKKYGKVVQVDAGLGYYIKHSKTIWSVPEEGLSDQYSRKDDVYLEDDSDE